MGPPQRARRCPFGKCLPDGINHDEADAIIAARQSEGHTAFKLKVGFGAEKDLANLSSIRRQFGPVMQLMIDANQAWTLDEARNIAPRLSEFGLAWLEEPLRADRPINEWTSLAAICSTPLAAGENIIGENAFLAMLDASVLDIVQPDIAKWGGISGCWPVIQAIQAKGKRYCPHYLGAGVGLLASAHLLAAVGEDGLLEIDSNPNPLRSELCGALSKIQDGYANLDDAPGIGVPHNMHQSIQFT